DEDARHDEVDVAAVGAGPDGAAEHERHEHDEQDRLQRHVRELLGVVPDVAEAALGHFPVVAGDPSRRMTGGCGGRGGHTLSFASAGRVCPVSWKYASSRSGSRSENRSTRAPDCTAVSVAALSVPSPAVPLPRTGTLTARCGASLAGSKPPRAEASSAKSASEAATRSSWAWPARAFSWAGVPVATTSPELMNTTDPARASASSRY